MSWKFYLRSLLVLVISLILMTASFADELPITLEKPRTNLHDIASIKRGAKAYATYCLVCHSLKYLKHDPIAQDAGITEKTMPDQNKKWWFKTPPPDLSLEVRVRGEDWVYTYLHSFYKDTSSPIGFNNLLFDNTAMPNPFGGIQGVQVLVVNKNHLFKPTSMFVKKPRYYSVLELVNKGTMSSDEFDQMITDLITFLVYASEPKRLVREKIGIWVLIFFAIFFMVVWLLKREYWRKLKQ